MRQEADVYGVAARAGAISPQQADEDHFRRKLGLPAASPDVESAWARYGGVRQPITYAPPSGTPATPPSAAALTGDAPDGN